MSHGCDQVGMNVRAKFGDSTWNNGQIIWLFLSVTPIVCTFVQYLIPRCSRQEAASVVLSGMFSRLIVPDKLLKFDDPHLNRSQEITPETVGGSIFNSFTS